MAKAHKPKVPTTPACLRSLELRTLAARVGPAVLARLRARFGDNLKYTA